MIYSISGTYKFDQSEPIMKKHSEIVELQGGLGNQLFGWVYATYRASQIDSKVMIMSTKLNKRGFQLGQFGISPGKPPFLLELINQLSKKLPFRLVEKLLREINVSIIDVLDFRKTVLEGNLQDISSKRVLHRGYFQELIYVNSEVRHQMNELKNNFKGSDKYYETLENKIFKEFNAIHIRGGDYLKHNEVFLLPNKSYYEKCVKLLNNPTEIPLVVFTNDHEYSLKLFPSADLIVSENYGLTPADNLMIMSKSSGFIGANSTFSWWAAMFRDANLQAPFFPWPWLKNNLESSRTLIPHNWNVVEINQSGNPID
jgi:hypothetical protein